MNQRRSYKITYKLYGLFTMDYLSNRDTYEIQVHFLSHEMHRIFLFSPEIRRIFLNSLMFTLRKYIGIS